MKTLRFILFPIALGLQLYSTSLEAQSVIKVTELNSQQRAERVDDEEVILFNGKIIGSIQDDQLGNELFVSDGTQGGTDLLLDLNPGPASSDADDFTVFGNFLFFEAKHASTGRELWRTDGTPAGTVLVTDLMPGSDNSSPSGLAVLGSKLLFRATSPFIGQELCVLDTPNSVTPTCIDINPTGSSSPLSITPIGSIALFAASNGVNGVELFRTNGTAAGTSLVKDINPNAGSSFPGGFKLAPTGVVVFYADDGTNGEELWRTNGATSGTELLFDIAPGAGSSSIEGFTQLGGFLYFTATTATSGGELWRTSGLPGSTTLVADINPGSEGSFPDDLVVFDNTLFFTATRSDVGEEIFFSDGSAPGTALFKDINPGPQSSSPSSLSVVNNLLFFGATSANNGEEPWVSNGSSNGTFELINFSPGNEDTDVENIFNFGGSALIFADSELTGDRSSVFFLSNGTPAGTELAFKLIRPGTDSADIRSISSIGSEVIFSATDGLTGLELYKSDSTAAGTVNIVDRNPGLGSFRINDIVSLGSKVIFDQIDGFFNPTPNFLTSQKIFVSDGTPSGTLQIFNFESQFFISTLRDSALLGNRLVFSATLNPTQGSEPWITDGTPSGTLLLKDIEPDGQFQLGSRPSGFTTVGNQVFFAAGSNSSFLWTTDGTQDGTRKIGDFMVTQPLLGKLSFVTTGAGTFFSGSNANNFDFELFKTDGTDSGTSLVKNIVPVGSSFPELMGSIGQFVIFNAVTPESGRELWRSDGTESGTVKIKEITAGQAGTNFSFTSSGINYKDKFYFTVNNPDQTSDLWSTDGFENGTNLVAKIRNPGFVSNEKLIVFDDKMFFVGNDNVAGEELWISNGSPEGSVRLLDISPGIRGSSPRDFTLLGDTLVFSADDNINGRELYAVISANDQCPQNVNKSQFGVCGCDQPDTDLDANGLIDCVLATPTPTFTTIPEILPGKPKLKVKNNILTFTIPKLSGASFEIFILNKKGKVIKKIKTKKTKGSIKRLKPGRYKFAYRILNGEIISQNSTALSFRIKNNRR